MKRRNRITELWMETDCDFDGQGHRRNMLKSSFTHVGIAGYKKNGTTYWVQAFGESKSNKKVLATIRLY